jgi:hypothetical protein
MKPKLHTKYFFTHRKILGGRPQPLWLELVVSAPNRAKARLDADNELAFLKAGIRALQREQERLDKTVRSYPDFRFVGVN